MHCNALPNHLHVYALPVTSHHKQKQDDTIIHRHIVADHPYRMSTDVNAASNDIIFY